MKLEVEVRGVRHLRMARGLTPLQAATQLQITRQHLSDVELGQAGAGFELMVRMRDLYGVTLDQLAELLQSPATPGTRRQVPGA